MTESRVIVKGIPRYLNELRFKNHFHSLGNITDIKIMKNRDGISRKFGFIGFKNKEEAELAIEKFNNSFIDTSKISVCLAMPYGDEKIPRPWSKYSKGSSAFEKRVGKKKERIFKEKVERKKKKDLKSKNVIDMIFDKGKKRKFDEMDDDPKFKEFVNVALSNKTTKLWQNDDMTPEQFSNPNKKRRIGNEDSDSEDYQIMPSLDNMDNVEDEKKVDDNEDLEENENKKSKDVNDQLSGNDDMETDELKENNQELPSEKIENGSNGEIDKDQNLIEPDEMDKNQNESNEDNYDKNQNENKTDEEMEDQSLKIDKRKKNLEIKK